MKKVQKLLILVLCLALLGAFGLFAVACGGDDATGPADGKVRVTFYDGNKALSYTDIDKDSKVKAPETNPTKDGYEFVRWCATPSFSQPFNFDSEISESIGIYAGFRSTAEDTHTWYLAGASAVSDLFKESGDYKEFKDASAVPASVKLAQDATKKNKFSITADFYTGDKFQVLNSDEGWAGQIGYGYMNYEQYTTEETGSFYGKSNPYADGAKKADILVGASGNYTITLVVDKDGKLTELSYVRNGDAAELAVEYNYFIKGDKVTAWQNMIVDYTMFATEDKSLYTLTIGMQAGDDFMFISTKIGDTTNAVAGNYNISAFTLSDDAKTTAAIEQGMNGDKPTGNFKIKGGIGTYKFTIDESTIDDKGGKMTLKAEKVADTVPAYDFYVKGSMGGDSKWENRYPMTENTDGTYSYVATMAKDDKFQITVTEHGKAPATGIEKDVFGIGTGYANGAAISNQIDYQEGNDFKALAADKFTITINPINMRVSIEGEHDTVVYTVSVFGTMNSWAGKECCKISTETAGLTATFELELESGAEFQFRTRRDKSTTDIDYMDCNDGRNGTWTTCAGLEGTGNIKCVADGTYKFVVVIAEDGKFVSVTASVVAE